MRANRLALSSWAAGAGLLLVFAGCSAPPPPPPPEISIPVSRAPGRASNEELVVRAPADKEPAPVARATEGVTVVDGAPAPTAVARADSVAKEQPANEPAQPNRTAGEPTPAPPPTVSAGGAGASAKPGGSAATQPAAPSFGYGSEEYRLVNQSDEIVSVLKNGLVVIAKKVPSPVVAVRGYVNTGGVYEGKWLGGGLSHLLEHLVAGGSSQRRTEAQNRDLLQRIGNDSNAYTTADHTAYYVNTTPEHMTSAVDLVTGWLFGALITPEEYKREYEVVQRELEKDKGEPDWVFYELSQHNRYRVSPARVPTIGYKEVIQGLSRDDVFNYYKLAYIPNNMVFTVTGNVAAEEMLRAVQKNVADVKPDREFSRDVPQEPPVLAPRTVVATFPKLGQAKLQLAFPSVKMDHPDLYALDLLSTIVGGGESSILVEELRDKRRLVNAVGAGNPTPTYADGSFEIDMELPPEKIGEATDATLALLDGVIKDGVSADRLKRAKVQMRASRVKSLQTSERVASSLAADFINTGDPHFTDRYIKRIEEVTAEQVQAVAKFYFDRQRLLTTALLPSEYVGSGGLPKAEDLIRPVAPTTKDAANAEVASKVTRAELPNGAILLHKRLSTSPLVAVQVYAIGGLSAEDAKTNGLGNLTMEMLPRGTASRNAQQIAEFFDSIGGDLETRSGNNSWYWGATCLKDDFEKAMDVFADVVANPAFPEPELGPMKQRITAAIDGQDADWHSQAMRFFRASYFGPRKLPYQFVSIGTKQNVESFTREQVQQFYANQVMTARRVIAIYGDVDLEKARSIAAAKLGAANPVKDPRPPAGAGTPPPDKGQVPSTPAVEVTRVELNKTEQPLAGVVVGFEADSVVGSTENYPIDVADTMASGYTYPTGYLHEILRGRGLVYVVHGTNFPGRSTDLPGVFMVYAGCDPSKVNEVVDVILQNVARVQGSEKDTQPGWFDRSKQLITTSDAMANETPAEQASTAAIDELFGLGFDFHDQFAERIKGVNVSDVRNVAGRRLSRAVVTVSTPAPEAVQVKPGKRTYDSFPPVDLTPRGVQHDSK